MPELPEVETIMRRLRDGTQDHPPLPGHKIQSVEIFWDRIIQEPDHESFKKNLQGKAIIDTRRRGKFLHFPLNVGHLIGHLRMSGDMCMEKRVTAEGNAIPKEKYDQIIFNLNSNWRLAFNSIRKFSRMWVVEDPQSVFGELGPEPLSAAFTPERLDQMLHDHSRQIKPLLMDQKFIAGLGNIYTDEILFCARIHPLRKSNMLSKQESGHLFVAIQEVLRKGIQSSGASLDWMYRGGEFQSLFKVHQREGEPCPECGTIVKKFIVGQRGTYICPRCQKEPGAA